MQPDSAGLARSPRMSLVEFGLYRSNKRPGSVRDEMNISDSNLAIARAGLLTRVGSASVWFYIEYEGGKKSSAWPRVVDRPTNDSHWERIVGWLLGYVSR